MNASNPARFPFVRLVLGLAILALGVILLGDAQGWLDGWRLAQWWPVAPTAFGLARLLQDGPLSGRGHLWLGFGAAGFLSQFSPPGRLERLWPVLLIYAGVILTLRAVAARRPAAPSPDPGSTPDSTQVTP